MRLETPFQIHLKLEQWLGKSRKSSMRGVRTDAIGSKLLKHMRLEGRWYCDEEVFI